MYNKLLENVIKVINTTAQISSAKQHSSDDVYNMMFRPELFEEERQRRIKQEDMRNKLVLVATGLAVVGEAYHIVKSVMKNR